MFKNQIRKTLLYIHGLKNQTSNLQKHLYKEKIQTCEFNACGSETFFKTDFLTLFCICRKLKLFQIRLEWLSIFKAVQQTF